MTGSSSASLPPRASCASSLALPSARPAAPQTDMTRDDMTGSSSVDPVIVSAVVAAGHDGRAEVVVEVAYPNGGRTRLSVAQQAVDAALDAAGVQHLDDLRGQPWTVLLGGPVHRLMESSRHIGKILLQVRQVGCSPTR